MMIVRLGAVAASALLFGLAGSIEQPWAALVWIALIPWLASLDRECSWLGTLASAAMMSGAFVVVIFTWFAAAVARYAELSPALMFALLVAAGPLLQTQFLVFAAVRRLVRTNGGGHVLVALSSACAWVGSDWLFPHLFGDALGTGLFAFETLRQGADIAGVAGLTFVIVLVNEAIFVAIIESRRSAQRAAVAVASAVVLLSLLTGYGAMRLQHIATATTEHAPLRAALVQANLGDYEGLRESLGSYESVRSILDAHEDLSLEAISAAPSESPVELLVWPETVYPTTFDAPKSEEGAKFDEEIKRFAAVTGTPLVFGSYSREDEREFNTAFLLQYRGGGETSIDLYNKKNLFPLTEYVPAWLDSESLRADFPWLGSWTAGDRTRVFNIAREDGHNVRAVPLICLDAVDPDLALDGARSGADLLVTMSNDGWFSDSPGANLHLVVSAFRSIETRLPQLRATNTGISAVISPTGEIVTRSTVGQATALIGTVRPGKRAPTLMIRWGDWFGPVAAAAAGALLLLAVAFRREDRA